MYFRPISLNFCLLALALLFSTTSAVLEGSNVCTRIESYTYQVVVSEQEPYKVTESEWCFSFPPRCQTSRNHLRTVHKTQNLVRQRIVEDCCEGFTLNSSEDGCVPECSMDCIYGTCVAPDQCSCEVGYGGPSCDISCPFGFWGSESCQNRCQCENNFTCDPFNGECLCSSGWTGERCENKCDEGTYGQDCLEKCQCGNGTCDHVSGECSCKSGWIGSLCDIPCPPGTHGTECESECRCQNGGTCDPESGECFCQPGWTGSVCANRCPSGFWGANCSLSSDCSNGASCHHITGECECKPGFVGEKCAESCPDGTFGLNCTETCNCDGASCSSTTGKCLCPSGWNGKDCKERNCPEGLWGPKCDSTCDCHEKNSVMCNPWTGVCECKPGWIGKDCSESLLVLNASFIHSTSTGGVFYGIIAGAITAVVLLLITVSYVFYKRRLKPDDILPGGKNSIYHPVCSYENDEKKNNEIFNDSKINMYSYEYTKDELKSGKPAIDADKKFIGRKQNNIYTPAPFKTTPPRVEEIRLLKNHAAELANLTVYAGPEEDHIYEEIKNSEVEYDELNHARHEFLPRYQQVTVSVMSPSWEFKSK